jgi:hypothetical protein
MLNFHRLALVELAKHFDLDLAHLAPDCLVERAIGREKYRKFFYVQMMGLERQLVVYVYDFEVLPERYREACKEQYEAELHASTISRTMSRPYFPVLLKSYADNHAAVILADMT